MLLTQKLTLQVDEELVQRIHLINKLLFYYIRPNKREISFVQSSGILKLRSWTVPQKNSGTCETIAFIVMHTEA